MLRLRRKLRLGRSWHYSGEEGGQALVEAAIVLPLMVMILLFMLWVWELITIKLKVQEAARYAAWESTAWKLHDYNAIVPVGVPEMRYSMMQFAVPGEAMTRYANFNSTNYRQSDRTMLMARWKRPLIVLPPTCSVILSAAIGIALGTGIRMPPLCGNEKEELMPGGGILNWGMVMAIQAFEMVAGLLYSNPNPVAESLIRIGFGAGGMASIAPFGIGSWGFNQRGYIRAVVRAKVENNWFNISLWGKYLFEDPDITFMDYHGVLADHWNLFQGINVFNWVDFRARGFFPEEGLTPAFYKQISRMYLGSKRAHLLYAAQWAPLFWNSMQVVIRAMSPYPMLFMTGPLDTILTAGMLHAPYNWMTALDLVRPAIVSLKHDPFGAIIGRWITPDTHVIRIHHTVPFKGHYRWARLQRGPFFLGCWLPQQLGCTHTLGQMAPWGNYLVR